MGYTKETLKKELAKRRFIDISKICKAANGGELGIDPHNTFNRDEEKFAHGGVKGAFANWAVNNVDNAKLAVEMVKYPESQRQYGGRLPNTYSTFNPQRAGTYILSQSTPVTIEPNVPMPGANPPEPNASSGRQASNVQEPTIAQIPANDPAAPDWAKLVNSILEQARQKADSMDRTMRASLSEEIEALTKRVDSTRVLTINVKHANGQTTTTGATKAHCMFPELLQVVMAGEHAFMVGPAGTGKSHAGVMLAEAMGLPFYLYGRVDDEFKLTGFIDAHGAYQETDFYRAWTHGGVILLDELPQWHPTALAALNAALAGNLCSFPTGTVRKHPDCFVVAAGNSDGQGNAGGSTRYTTANNMLDGSSLDRFSKIDWDHDESLEMSLALLPKWFGAVQQVRRNAKAAGVDEIFSLRAMLGGQSLLLGLRQRGGESLLVHKGMSLERVIAVRLRKSIADDTWARLQRGVDWRAVEREVADVRAKLENKAQAA